MMTMIVCASPEARFTGTFHLMNASESSCAILFPEKIPVRIPINVIPICIVERKLSGLSISFRAVLAEELPLPASEAMLLRLAEISAI